MNTPRESTCQVKEGSAAGSIQFLDDRKMRSEASQFFEGALCRDTGLAAGLRITCVQEATHESLSPTSDFQVEASAEEQILEAH